MTTTPTYSIYSLDLTTAGSQTIHGPWEILRFVDAVDAADAVVASAKITVQLDRDGEGIPVRLGMGVLSRATRRWILSWTAQAGVTAKLLFSSEPGALDMDADPPVKLTTGDLAAAITQAAVTVGTAAVEVAAANADRKSVTIYNAGSAMVYLGDDTVTTADGLPLAVDAAFTFSGTTAAIYAVGGTAGQDVRVLSEG